jgi:DinB family protein
VSAKQKLLDDEDRRWREMHARFGKLSAEDWLRPGVNGEWNAKDLLAHVAAWHAHTTDRFEALRETGELPEFTGDVDEFNRKLYEENRDLTLHEVQAMSGAARHRFREEIDLLPDEPAERVQQIVYANADEHYDEHIPHLDAFLGGP